MLNLRWGGAGDEPKWRSLALAPAPGFCRGPTLGFGPNLVFGPGLGFDWGPAPGPRKRAFLLGEC